MGRLTRHVLTEVFFRICYSIVATFITVISKMIAAFPCVRVCDCVCALCVLPHFSSIIRQKTTNKNNNKKRYGFVIYHNA